MTKSFTLTKANIHEIARRLQTLLAGKLFTSVRTNEFFGNRIEINSPDVLSGSNYTPRGDMAQIDVNDAGTFLSIHCRSGLLTFSAAYENEQEVSRKVLDDEPEFDFIEGDDNCGERVQITYLNNRQDRHVIVHIMLPICEIPS